MRNNHDNSYNHRPYDEHFDYTKWREDKFDDMSLHEIGQVASDFIKTHPFKGKNTTIL